MANKAIEPWDSDEALVESLRGTPAAAPRSSGSWVDQLHALTGARRPTPGMALPHRSMPDLIRSGESRSMDRLDGTTAPLQSSPVGPSRAIRR